MTTCCRRVLIICLSAVLYLALISGAANAGAIIADHNAAASFNQVPLSVVTSIGTSYNIYYAHTSHGSQIMTGLSMVHTEDDDHDQPPFHEVGDDLGHSGDTTWVPATRTYLDAHPECNMVMFSWCGGVSDNTEAGIDIYLAKMEELEADYPSLIFIYMTGHLDGSGVSGTLYARNNQIREYCNSHDKILFDFADIESFDPDGAYYPDASDACEWCYDWCALYTCPTCGSCAHSHCYNCFLKGKAWWWMMARISGWTPTQEDCCGRYTGGVTGNANCSTDGALTLSDITRLIDNVYISRLPLCCSANGNTNGSLECKITLSDITRLIDAVYISKSPPENCMPSCEQ